MFKHVVSALVLIISLQGCGGGGGSSSTPVGPPADTTPPVVTISGDAQNKCWTIIQEYPASANPTRTITASCTTPKPVESESCPTMTFFARYLKCNDDRIEIIGNNTENFPNYIKQISTGDCWSLIDRTSQTQNDDNFNLGCTPTSKFQIDFLKLDLF